MKRWFLDDLEFVELGRSQYAPHCRHCGVPVDYSSSLDLDGRTAHTIYNCGTEEVHECLVILVRKVVTKLGTRVTDETGG